MSQRSMRRSPWSRPALAPWFLVSCSAVLGCAPLDDDAADQRDDEVRVTPEGSDRPGSLQVVIPGGGIGAVDATTFECQARQAPLGDTLSALPVGQQTFTLKTDSPSVWFRSTSKADILAGTTTKVTAGLVAFDAVSGPRTLGLGALPCSTGIPMISLNPSVVFSGGPKATSNATTRAPLLEADYELDFGFNATDGIRVSIKAGTSTTVKLTQPADRRITRLKAPVRELPTATCGGGGDKEWFIGLANNAGGGSQSVLLKDGEELDLGVSKKKEGAQYLVYHRAWQQWHKVPLGERGAGPRLWTMGRIDVDHVSINGGPPSLPGVYAIYPANAAGEAIGANMLRCKPATNSGVDIPPGRYRVVVDYRTVEAGMKQDVHVVDVP